MKKLKLLMKDLLKLSPKQRLKLQGYVIATIGYISIVSIVLAFSLLIGKLLEAAFILGGFFTTRFLVPKIKHFATPQKCILVSSMTFVLFLAVGCIPKNISVIWSILVGAVIPLLMYAESLLFDPVISDKDKLIALCRKHNYNFLKTQMAIKFFHDKEKPREVWLWLCETQPHPMEWESVRKAKYRMRKELFQDAE